MHGEYKVPAGKLLVVDLDVADGVIVNARLAGDFFLEPDEALDDINAALNGLSAQADSTTIADAVRANLRADAVLLGFSPESVGVVVRRALAEASSWCEFEWEVVHEPSVSPVMHLALDEVLSHSVASGLRKPTMRIWEWDSSAVVIGSFQSVKNEVDLEAATAEGFEVVRRASGGGAMMMERGNVITYSLYAPAELVAGMSFADSYAFLDDWVLQALAALGIEASYKPLNDITAPDGKIGGAAQKRFSDGGILHHVTMSYDMDHDKMVRVLRIGREKLSDKGITSAKKRVDPLRSQTGMTRAEIIEALKGTFTTLYGASVGSISDAEREAAEALVAEKYSSDAWLNRVP